MNLALLIQWNIYQMIILVNCYGSHLRNIEWHNFKKRFHKNYAPEQEEFRKSIFYENYEIIEEHHLKFRNGSVTFQMGITEFADMTDNEYNTQLMATTTTTTTSLHDYHHHDSVRDDDDERPTIENHRRRARRSIPDYVNWVQFGYQNSILSQGQCGSCYIFAAIATIEGQYYIKYKKLIQLSHQELLDCMMVMMGGGGGSNQGCQGGYRDKIYQYIKEHGIGYARDYPPYTAKTNSTSECRKISYPLVTIKNYHQLRAGDEVAMKQAVAENGLVSVGIYAGLNSFKLYTGGLYYDRDCANITVINHSMTVVGYGRMPSDGQEYWLIRNSWGQNWGEMGYVKFARNRQSHCGVADRVIYPVL